MSSRSERRGTGSWRLVQAKLARIFRVASCELRLVAREPAMLVAYTVMPLALVAVVNNAFRNALLQLDSLRLDPVIRTKLVGGTGAEVSVGGISAVFSIILLANFGLFFYRDHSTGVWNRCRSTYSRPLEIMSGKMAATWVVHFSQLVGLLIFAQWRYDLPVTTHWPAVLALAVCTVTATVALGFAMAAFFRSSNSFEATAIAGGLVLGVLGASFSPHEFLPKWSRPLQPLSPVRWSSDGFRAVFLSSKNGFTALQACLALLAFALLLVAVGLLRFNPDEAKSKTR